MHAFLFFCVMTSILALDPAHLRPGALTAHLGRASLVEDVMWVRYPYTALMDIPGRLQTATEHLDVVLDDLEEAALSVNPTLLELMRSRLQHLNATISLALENYYGLDESNRSKRGLIDGMGHLSRMLFGTAMNEDVEELREKYNLLSSTASTNNRVIGLNCRNIARLEMHVHDFVSHLESMRLFINNVAERADAVQDVLIINQGLSVLENIVNSLLHTNMLVIQNLVDAARGRVSSSLFPVKDLLHTLTIGKHDFNLEPLFAPRSIQHYYPLLESVLTSDAVVIHVPFQSQDTFEVHQIEPFPFAVNGTVMVLNLPPTVVLIAKDFSLYAVTRLSDLQKCRTEYHHLYHCPAYLFAFFPVTGGICEIVLTQTDASRALSLCPYTQLAPKPLFHSNFFGVHYFYFTHPVFVSVVCPNHTDYREVKGHLAVLIACHLRSANLSTFPSKLHHGFTANFSNLIFPMDSLNNLSFSSIKYVTNTLSEFKFSNSSGLVAAVQESLPAYLTPQVHYPSLVAPVILIILIVVPLVCCVRKALTLYSHLHGIVKADTVNINPQHG